MSKQRCSWPKVAALTTIGLILVMLGSSVHAQGRAVQLTALDGSRLAEADLLKGASIVVVWASWSPRCRDIVSRVNAIESKWGRRARVVMVDFQEDRETIESFLGNQRVSVPVFMDPQGAFSKKHAVTTLPGLLIYKDGQVAYRGKLPNDADALIGEILD